MYKTICEFTPAEICTDIPASLEQAIDKDWLNRALAPLSGGASVASVEMTELVQAMAAKVRVAVTFAGQADTPYHLCIKGFLDDELAKVGALTTLREADFYLKIAPEIAMRTPPCPIVVADRSIPQCIFIMADMIQAGAHFYNALEPFTVQQVEETLNQLAMLHASSQLLPKYDWIPNRIQDLADSGGHFSQEKMQSLMHDERRSNLSDRTLDAGLLLEGIKKLAIANNSLPHTLLHGDVHPGNVYRDSDGLLAFTDWQLIQRGHWSLDIAYHIASVLPVEVAEKEEQRLLQYYLDALHKHGGEKVSLTEAWPLYQQAMVYGYYQWAITQRVHPPITQQAFKRLGEAVSRHESYRLLGL